MKKASLIFVYFLGLHLMCAQENYKLRIGINNFFSAGHYNRFGAEVVSNEYYTFKKVPLTFQTFPELTLNLLVEKKINAKNAIQMGVLLNDAVGTGYKIGTQTEIQGKSATTGFIEVASGYGGSQGGLASTRLYGGITHEILPLTNFCDTTLKKYNVVTEIALGVNVILMPFGEPNVVVPDFSYGAFLKTGDKANIFMGTYKLDRKWGATVLGGFNFKLRKYKKEIITLSVSYEQGIWDMLGKRADIYINKYHFKELVMSRGSRLNITISRAFGYPKFLKMKNKK